MNTFKAIVVVGVLAGVGYWVYTSIQKNAATDPPAEDVAEPWVTVPDGGAMLPEYAGPTGGSGLGSGLDATGNPAAADAPPFAPNPPDPDRIAQSVATLQGTSMSPPQGATPPLGPGTASPGAASPAMGGTPPDADPVRVKFNEFVQAALEDLQRGRFVEVHEGLSRLYGDPRLPPDLADRVTHLLDQVAGVVIYSRQHMLEPAYVVQPGETLEQIAQSYNVPWQLLAKINGIRDPHSVSPGRELKVVRGPFQAVVHLDCHELTLMLNGLYAGRFPIGVGQDNYNLEGTFEVSDKTIDPTYYGPTETIAANDPNNPYGRRWIGLGGRIGIHGTNDPATIGRSDAKGAICLGDRDVDDVYDILSVGSKVVIMR